jgi:molybdenum cofactor cytidylyltransferase
VSSRMGEFKPLLPLGNKTVIEQVVVTFLRAGVRDIRVVLGYRARDVIAVLKNQAVSWIINDDYQSEMLGSVKVGANCLEPDSEAFFILPVDIPLVRFQTLQSLMDIYGKNTPQIVYPTFAGERGHPPLIPRRYTDELNLWFGQGGLKGFLDRYNHQSLNVPVADEGILMDMDTPDQYRQLVARYDNRQIPSKAECMAMMATRFSDDHPVLKHSKVVAKVAQVVGKKLVHAGCEMDINLVEACGYLHDIGKSEKKHAKFGAQLLKNWGYLNIADIIACHIDLPFAEEGKITEKEVIYLADKLTHGENILSLDERLEVKLKQLSGHPEGKIAAAKRIQTAMKIERAIEGITGEKILWR